MSPSPDSDVFGVHASFANLSLGLVREVLSVAFSHLSIFSCIVLDIDFSFDPPSVSIGGGV